MGLERLREALDFALRLHQGQTWPGSQIPYFAHSLEVACRVATLGGDEDTVIAGLLHEARRDQDGATILRQIQESFGDRVAGTLETCWKNGLLPHAGWEDWLPGAAEDPELRLIVVCDALCCFRTLLLDWQVLAHLWDEVHLGDPTDRLWLQQQAHLPPGDSLIRDPWVPKSVEHPSSPELRRELADFFQGWMSLPMGPSESVIAYPSLTLAYHGDSWGHWVDAQALVPVVRAWGFIGIAQEMQIVLGRLAGLPGLAKAGFLRRSARDPGLMKPEVAAECLRRMTMVELMLVLSNHHSPLVHSFRRQVPMDLLDLAAPDQSPRERARAALAEPILLHWLGEVARDGCILKLPPLGSHAPEVPHDPCVPRERYGAALSLLFEAQSEENWPITTIPYVYHPLEVSSLVLTAGWDEETALLALLHDLPQTEENLNRVQGAMGTATREMLEILWRLEGLAHRARRTHPGAMVPESAPPPLRAVTLMDATSLLRFVAEDYQALGEMRTLRQDPSRHELAKRLLFFRGFLYGRPLRAITDTVLIETRFGQTRGEWQKTAEALKQSPILDLLAFQEPIGEGAEEISTLLARLQVPLPEVTGLACLLESMKDWEVRHLCSSVGIATFAEAIQDPGWDPVRRVVVPRLDPTLIETIEASIQTDPQDTKTIRRAQTAVLAMAASLRPYLL